MGQDVATNRLLGVCLEAESEGCITIYKVSEFVVVVVHTTGLWQ